MGKKPSAAAKARRAAQYFPDEHNERVVSKFMQELEAHLEESGIAIDSFSIRPINIIGDAIPRDCIDRYEARTQNSSGAARLAPSQEVVLLAATGPQAKGIGVGPKVPGPTAQEPRAHQVSGPSVHEPRAQGHKGTLGLDLGGRNRLYKPRSLKQIDGIMWVKAQQLSLKEFEIAEKYGVPSEIESYHSSMCRVGQQALADAIHDIVKTQAIYDALARSATKFKRESRKFK